VARGRARGRRGARRRRALPAVGESDVLGGGGRALRPGSRCAPGATHVASAAA
jgi:hypothetical protein